MTMRAAWRLLLEALLIPGLVAAAPQGRLPQQCVAAAHLEDRLDGHCLLQARKAQLWRAPRGEGQGGGGTAALKAQYPFYHTSHELAAEASRLVRACGGRASLRSVQKGNVTVDVVRVKSDSRPATNRVFVLFGEHSRELISPESGLQLLRVLCGEAPSSAPSGATVAAAAEAALRDSEFELVLNGNPRSRALVEGGDFCLRENPQGVDLNRNWDEKWQGSQASFGPHPFSEPETQIFRSLVTEFQPTTFLSVHSGTYGMYMPWAYDTETLATRNQAAMMQILRSVDREHCQCPFGAAGKEVGYACPGSSLDWVYDQLGTAFAFAFEIYTSEDMSNQLKSRWDTLMSSPQGASLLQEGHHLAHPHFADLFRKHPSDFVQLASKRSQADAMSNVECFRTFNPETREKFEAIVQNWAAAFLQMALLTAAELKKANSSKI